MGTRRNLLESLAHKLAIVSQTACEHAGKDEVKGGGPGPFLLEVVGFESAIGRNSAATCQELRRRLGTRRGSYSDGWMGLRSTPMT